jgi:hypothetical protein
MPVGAFCAVGRVGLYNGNDIVELRLESDGAGVDFYRHTKNRWDLIKFIYPPTIDFSERDYEHRSGGSFLSPAMHGGYEKLTPQDGGEQMTHNVNHVLTPEQLHYYW